MDNLKIAILIIIFVTLGATGVYYFYQRSVTSQDFQPTETVNQSPRVGFEVSPSPRARKGTVAGVQPAAGSDTVEVKNIGIIVKTPQSSTAISSPLKITGNANVLEGKVAIRIKDATGQILGQGAAAACLGYDACPFETEIAFNSPRSDTGSIEVYNPSFDGSQKYLQGIPVSFK